MPPGVPAPVAAALAVCVGPGARFCPCSFLPSFFLPARRNIDKAGGLDEYILTTPDKHLDSDKALELRQQLLSRLQRQASKQQQQQMLSAAAQAAMGAADAAAAAAQPQQQQQHPEAQP